MNLTYLAIITHEDALFYIGFPDIEENIEDCFYVSREIGRASCRERV